MPFITFVTRSHKRPELLKRNQHSIYSQSDKDYEHCLIIDTIGHNRLWCNQQFYENRHRFKGQYVYNIDDDDYLIYPDFIKDLKNIAKLHSPDVILFRVQTDAHIFPLPDCWKKKIIMGSIGGACFCVTNEVYQRHIHAFGKTSCGDYHFIKEVFKHGYKHYWFDKIVTFTPDAHRSTVIK